MKSLVIIIASVIILTVTSHSQSENSGSLQIPHLEKHGTATQFIVNGKPFLMFAGELNNSTAGGFGYMRPVWERLAKKNLNAVIGTVSWELVEPTEGHFEFSLVDSEIAEAREAHLKLALIWFGSWKNGSSVYIPSWVKEDTKKYPKAMDEHGKPLEIVSTFGEATRDADAKAFAALMHHIKEVDSKQQTVIMVQVENEVGVIDRMWKTPGDARRDFCTAANAAYEGPVPQKLLDYLVEHKNTLFPNLFEVWGQNGFKTSGSWEEVFGKSEFRPERENWQFYSFYTEELFSAWNYANYVERVVEAGKKEYPLPMYVNAWLKQPYSYWPGSYPSGGPLPQVQDLWRAAAPSIDFFSPDVYLDEFTWACQGFVRNGNPLFIPEARGGEYGAAMAFYVFGEFDADCFSPFGIDGERFAANDPLAESYAVLRKMAPIILANQGKGTMRGILVDTLSPVQQLELGDHVIEARLGDRRPQSMAGGLIIQTGPNEFIVAGKALDIFFAPKDESLHTGIIAVDDGTIEQGKWVSERRLNGDETHASTSDGTGLKLPGDRVSIQKISLYTYK
jgi:hypothetical protein